MKVWGVTVDDELGRVVDVGEEGGGGGVLAGGLTGGGGGGAAEGPVSWVGLHKAAGLHRRQPCYLIRMFMQRIMR